MPIWFEKRISATVDASNPASCASEKPPSSSTLFSRALIVSFLYQTSYELFGLHESGQATYPLDCSPGLGGNRSGRLLGLVFTRTINLKHRANVFRRSEEHTSELQSLMRNSYAVFCLKKKNIRNMNNTRRKQRT